MEFTGERVGVRFRNLNQNTFFNIIFRLDQNVTYSSTNAIVREIMGIWTGLVIRDVNKLNQCWKELPTVTKIQ